MSMQVLRNAVLLRLTAIGTMPPSPEATLSLCG